MIPLQQAPALFPKSIRQKASRIRLVLMDVDGVLTRGDIVWSEALIEGKSFSVKDGQGLRLLQRAGISTGIITARRSALVEHRAKELGISFVEQGVAQKLEKAKALAETLQLEPQTIAYIGDDLPDLRVLQWVGLAVCPSDAIATVREYCHWISLYKGGSGAVRELCDLILNERRNLLS
jgi:3-deoxy-D-manno-octulosonate 8-phosphate phosphatase (KDO 8-P phosphatase)